MSLFSPLAGIEHSDYQRHQHWMRRAIALAQQAGDAGEVPVGAVVVDDSNQLVAEGENRRERDYDPTAHAEVVALRAAGRSLGQWRLNLCTLYVTLEPCPMCAGAIIQSRVKTLVYGLDDPKTGAIHTVLNLPKSACSTHHLQTYSGILEQVCQQQLRRWFDARRD